MRSYMLPPNMVQVAPTSQQGDYKAQLASAINQSYNSTSFKPGPLLSVIKQNPENPSGYANFLRCASVVFITTNREESYLLEYDNVPKDALIRHNISIDLLKLMNSVSQKGEQIDPDNAYFPFMRAAVFFTNHQDKDAVTELLKASKKSVWRDYSADQVTGQWKINSTGIGNTSALNLMLAEGSVNYSHYTLLRDAAHVAVYDAMMLEKSGNAKEGIKIREALLQISGIIRTQSNTNIGVLIGVTCGSIAIKRPGGMSQHQASKDELNNKDITQRLNDYTQFLTKSGETKLVPSMTDEITAGLQTKDTIINKLSTYSPMAEASEFLQLWVFGLMILLASIIMFLYAGIAQISLPLMSGKLTIPMVFSTLYGALAPVLFVLLSSAGLKGTLTAGLTIVTLVIALYVALLLIWRLPNADIQQCFINSAATALITLAILISLRVPVALIKNYKLPVFYHMAVFQICSIPFMLIIVTILVLSIYNLIRRKPLALGVTRCMVSFSPVVACLLFVLYAGTATMTYINEKSLEISLKQSLANEAIYTAQQANVSLPGPTDWTKTK